MRSIEKLKEIVQAYHAIVRENSKDENGIPLFYSYKYRVEAENAERFFRRNGLDCEYAKIVYSCATNDIETLNAYTKLYPNMFKIGDRTAELINFAIELKAHEAYVILLEFAEKNGIDLKPKLAL